MTQEQRIAMRMVAKLLRDAQWKWSEAMLNNSRYVESADQDVEDVFLRDIREMRHSLLDALDVTSEKLLKR